MARITKNNNLKPVIEAYQQWIRNCLIGDGSILSSGKLWTPDYIQELKKAFVDNPDLGDDDFKTKLKGQMKGASASAQKLMAEMLWALLVFPTNITPGTKRDQVRDFWSLSGEVLSERLPVLSDDVLDGIGSGGQAYNNYRWRELAFLIEIAGDLKNRKPTDRQKLLSSYDDFVDWIDAIPGADTRQFRHMLRYVTFPDRVERISSNADRLVILEACGIAPKKETQKWRDRQIDDALLKLRGKFQGEYPGQILDFYEPPLREKWQSGENSKTPHSPNVSFTTKDCEVFARYPASVKWADVSEQDQGLFKNVRERLKKLAEFLVASGTAPLPSPCPTSDPF